MASRYAFSQTCVGADTNSRSEEEGKPRVNVAEGSPDERVEFVRTGAL